jgi:cell division protein FtsB
MKVDRMPDLKSKLEKELRYYRAANERLMREVKNLNETVISNESLKKRIESDREDSNIIIDLLRRLFDEKK